MKGWKTTQDQGLFPLVYDSFICRWGLPGETSFWGVSLCFLLSSPWGNQDVLYSFPTFGIAHPHIPLTLQDPWATSEGQVLPSQSLRVRPWPFCFIKQTKAFHSITATCTVPLPACNHSLQLSALMSPWGGFVSTDPQWGPLMLQGTWSFSSDFLRSLFYLPSVPEFHQLTTKYTMGLMKIQKALKTHVCSCHFLEVFKTCTAN